MAKIVCCCWAVHKTGSRQTTGRSSLAYCVQRGLSGLPDKRKGQAGPEARAQLPHTLLRCFWQLSSARFRSCPPPSGTAYRIGQGCCTGYVPHSGNKGGFGANHVDAIQHQQALHQAAQGLVPGHHSATRLEAHACIEVYWRFDTYGRLLLH